MAIPVCGQLFIGSLAHGHSSLWSTFYKEFGKWPFWPSVTLRTEVDIYVSSFVWPTRFTAELSAK